MFNLKKVTTNGDNSDDDNDDNEDDKIGVHVVSSCSMGSRLLGLLMGIALFNHYRKPKG